MSKLTRDKSSGIIRAYFVGEKLYTRTRYGARRRNGEEACGEYDARAAAVTPPLAPLPFTPQALSFWEVVPERPDWVVSFNISPYMQGKFQWHTKHSVQH